MHTVMDPPKRQERGAAMKFTYASGSKTLAGYTIKRGIGRGGFGEVYYATSDAGKDVALKLIQRSLDVELRGVTQCLNLKNPHLIEIYDIRESESGETWIVMEYVSGGSLEDVLNEHPQGLSRANAMLWLRGMVTGVACLHDKGIVHRDLKPGNLFREDALVKIGDYGLSKFITASRRSAQTESIGTVHYMAPEVARGKYGKEIDIYAVGVMFYEMLTGRVPFEGESVGEILMKHLTAEPDLKPIEEPFRSVLAKALDKDPARRFASINDMLTPLVPTAVLVDGNGYARPAAAGIETSPRSEFWRAPLPQASPGVAAAPSLVVTQPTMHAITLPNSTAAKLQVRTPSDPITAFFADKWERLNRDSTSQATFWVLTVVLFTMTPVAPLMWGGLFWGAIGYGVYRVLWTMSNAPETYHPGHRAPTAVPRTSPESEQPAATAGRCAVFRRQRTEESMPAKGRHQQATELVASLVKSALAATVLSGILYFVMPMLGPNFDGGSASGVPMTMAQLALLTLVSIVGTWSILIPGKAWEGTAGRPIARRAVLTLAGLAVGGFAFAVDQYLLVDLPGTITYVRGSEMAFLTEYTGQPTVYGYLAFFAFLFLVPRWWKLSDPLRRTSFALWPVALCGVWGLVLAWGCCFPQPLGVMWGAITAMAVQLSAPWLSSAERERKTVVL